ncbi:hypothetical protein MMC07_001188 [Pseudocyphellaria aurata]|nr:hypothetical protein [Pseudocyphellaria aurata]
MSQQQTSSFSSRYSDSPGFGTPANASVPGVDASGFQVGDSGARLTKAEWNALAARLETKLRPWALRYGKLKDAQMVKVVREAIATNNIDSDDVRFKRCIIKLRTNQSTWKNRTLAAIELYVTRMLSADGGGMLSDTVDPKILFNHFVRRYSVHDAEDCFPWAAKHIKFGHVVPGTATMAAGPYFIKILP